VSSVSIGNRVAFLVEQFRNSIGLPFRDLLSEADITSALRAKGATYRERLFSPLGYRLGIPVASLG
jgi:hypothetical protein